VAGWKGRLRKFGEFSYPALAKPKRQPDVPAMPFRSVFNIRECPLHRKPAKSLFQQVRVGASPARVNLLNVWSAARLQGKSWWMKKVCVNVSGLFVESLFSWP
jgi:hypothetical protein